MSGPSDFQPTNPALKWIERRLPDHGPRPFLVRGLSDAAQPELLVDLRRHPFDDAGGADRHRRDPGDALHAACRPWPSSRSSCIVRDVNYGWLLRNMHACGASMFFFAVYIHMFRGLYYGSYKEPREVLWILGVIIYLLMMATGFMGYVLPWGQMSFWGATVITNLFSAIPVCRREHRDAAVGRLFGRQPDAEPLLLAALPAAVRDRRRGRAARLGAACRGPEQSGRRRAEDRKGHRAVHALRDHQGRVRRVLLHAVLSPGSSSTCRTISATPTTTSRPIPA